MSTEPYWVRWQGRGAPRDALRGKVCVVAGATRGAGRGIARALGEAGATVICTGRSVRGSPATGDRPETIEETAELVTRAGGVGRWRRVDHTDPHEVAALADWVAREHGGLDLLVNDVWGGDALVEWGRPFWELDPDVLERLWRRAVHSHVLTARHLAPLILARRAGLVVEVTDGDLPDYRGQLHYDLVKHAVARLAFGMSHELRSRGVRAVAVTPGFLRSEEMLERFGVDEARWREGAALDPHFAASETPAFVGRAIACLAADDWGRRFDGQVVASWTLADVYPFTDADGRRPHWGRHRAATLGIGRDQSAERSIQGQP